MEWASLRRRGEDVEEDDDDPDSTSGMFGMIANAKLASAKLASAAGTMLDSEKMENARRNVFNLDGMQAELPDSTLLAADQEDDTTEEGKHQLQDEAPDQNQAVNMMSKYIVLNEKKLIYRGPKIETVQKSAAVAAAGFP